MQLTLVRRIQATAFRRTANVTSERGRQLLQTISQRIPSSGMTLPQLQALLEDEMPSFSPATVGVNTLKEALQLLPNLVVIERDSDGREFVKRCVSDSAPEAKAIKDASTFFDMQKVLKHCELTYRRKPHNPFLRLEDVLLRTGVQNADIVHHVLGSSGKKLQVSMCLSIKPKRLPRAAIVFVDGDELPAAAVDSMCNKLNLIKEECIMHIVRHRDSNPLSKVDVISPDEVPTYLSIEKKVHEIRLRNPATMRDIIYMCSGKQYAMYAQHIAQLNAFPDADVYVCCPSRIEVVQPRHIIPFRPIATTL